MRQQTTFSSSSSSFTALLAAAAALCAACALPAAAQGMGQKDAAMPMAADSKGGMDAPKAMGDMPQTPKKAMAKPHAKKMHKPMMESQPMDGQKMMDNGSSGAMGQKP